MGVTRMAVNIQMAVGAGYDHSGALPPVTIHTHRPPPKPGVLQPPHITESGATLEISEPCKQCQNRSYKDQSNDANVSFKGGGKVSPGAAAAAVFSHEREHVANAMEKGRQEGANVSATVQIRTSICPECKQVYVSGGSTRVMMTGRGETPREPTGRSFDKSA
jgi:hypothetical protein